MASNPRRKSDAARRANQVIRSRTVLVMLLLGIVTFAVLFWKLYDIQIRQHSVLQEKAIEQQTGMHFTLIHYSEHALDSDTDSRACSYVGLKWASGEETWGCGTHTDIIVAGIKALVSAINNK